MQIRQRILLGLLGLVLLAICTFFLAIIWYLVSVEVLLAIEQGSLSIQTNSMILNILWEGNEFYIVLGFYFLLACVSGYGAFKASKRAFLGAALPTS